MRVKCMSTSCPGRRRHHDEPYVARGDQWVEAPDGHPGPYFCSLECWSYWKAEQKEAKRDPEADHAGV